MRMDEQELDENTTVASVPAVYVRSTLGKVGIDYQKFLKDEPGVMSVDHHIEDRQFSSVVKDLVKATSADTGFASTVNASRASDLKTLVDAIIVNLTTKNDLTDEELDVLYTIVKNGGKIKLENASMTPGLLKALGKKVKGSCSCGFTVPKYAGRYPAKCPRCSGELNLSAPPVTHVPEAFKAFHKLLTDYHSMVVGKGVGPGAIVEASEFAFNRAITGPVLEGAVSGKDPSRQAEFQEKLRMRLSFESDEQVFEWTVQYMEEVPGDRFGDAAFATIFELFPIEGSPNLVRSIREEVGQRDRLSQSIRSLGGNRFSVVKVLSSCLTRLMIEAENRGGDFYGVVGRATFQMMERAFEGDLDVPVRFIRSYYVGGGK